MAPVRSAVTTQFAAARPAKQIKGLVDGAENLVAAERGDDPLDLPPVTEMRDIAEIAAPLRTHRGFDAGVVAEAVDELGSIGERETIMDEGHVHRASIARSRFATADKYRQFVIDHVTVVAGGQSMSDV